MFLKTLGTKCAVPKIARNKYGTSWVQIISSVLLNKYLSFVPMFLILLVVCSYTVIHIGAMPVNAHIRTRIGIFER